MAVFTRINDDDLHAFLARYDVGQLSNYKGIAEGVQNTNYLVHTDQSQFILTLYEQLVEVEDLPFFLGLMEHLATHNISCPLPVHDKKGEILQTLAGRPSVMVTFLNGFSVARPKRVHCAELGAALAAMHKAGADFSMTRPNTLGPQGWQQVADTLTRDLPKLELEGNNPAHIVRTINEALDDIKEQWPAKGTLPTGIIHADLFPDNVFFLDEKLSGLIDFYFACTDFLAYDLAICLNAWCFENDGSFNMTNARALLNGYEKIRHLQQEELDALPILARGAALRFLLSRIEAWLHTPKDSGIKRHDPREYLRKLRFHQKVKNVSEYGFEVRS